MYDISGNRLYLMGWAILVCIAVPFLWMYEEYFW